MNSTMPPAAFTDALSLASGSGDRMPNRLAISFGRLSPDSCDRGEAAEAGPHPAIIPSTRKGVTRTARHLASELRIR
jgi:hypothetical protein